MDVKKGTPNRRTLELVERLDQLGCDPVAGLATIASDPATSLELKARCLEALLPYVYPKRKSIEMAMDALLGHPGHRYEWNQAEPSNRTSRWIPQGIRLKSMTSLTLNARRHITLR